MLTIQYYAYSFVYSGRVLRLEGYSSRKELREWEDIPRETVYHQRILSLLYHFLYHTFTGSHSLFLVYCSHLYIFDEYRTGINQVQRAHRTRGRGAYGAPCAEGELRGPDDFRNGRRGHRGRERLPPSFAHRARRPPRGRLMRPNCLESLTIRCTQFLFCQRYYRCDADVEFISRTAEHLNSQQLNS